MPVQLEGSSIYPQVPKEAVAEPTGSISGARRALEVKNTTGMHRQDKIQLSVMWSQESAHSVQLSCPEHKPADTKSTQMGQMGEMEQKDIKQQQMHVRGHLQVGEHACSSDTALIHFKRVVYALGRTGRSDKRDMELQGGEKAHPRTSTHNSSGTA